MRVERAALAAALLALGLAWIGARAAEEEAQAPGDAEAAREQARTSEREPAPPESELPPELPVYVPPSRGAVGARTGGGTRSAADAPRIAALAPDHVGLTTRAQPVLAWFLSRETQAPVVFTLIADGAIEPLVEQRVADAGRAGIHLVELAGLGVALEEGETYEWSISLVLDPGARDADVTAGGAVARVPAPPGLRAALAEPGDAVRELARHGIWYDAIADLSSAIEAAPEDASLRAMRAELLEQVGVGAAAAFDRRGDGAR